MPRKHGGVQHIGVGENDVCLFRHNPSLHEHANERRGGGKFSSGHERAVNEETEKGQRATAVVRAKAGSFKKCHAFLNLRGRL